LIFGRIMNTTRRLVAALAGSVTVAILAATPALAAPVNAPGVIRIPGTCADGEVVIVPPPSNGSWTPGFIEGTHQLVIPYEFTFVVRDSSGTIVDTTTETKPAPVPADAITCTFSQTVIEDGETFTVEGTVIAVVRGAP
jgi:hypothetical protein